MSTYDFCENYISVYVNDTDPYVMNGKKKRVGQIFYFIWNVTIDKEQNIFSDQ